MTVAMSTTTATTTTTTTLSRFPFGLYYRGGATPKQSSKQRSNNNNNNNVFAPLSKALLPYLSNDKDPTLSTTDIVEALESLASSQQTFKGLDGMAHEAYQRTHGTEDISLHVSGRALRTVARTQAVALGLGACELCEFLLLSGQEGNDNNVDDPSLLADKQVLYNDTITVQYQKQSLNVTVMVLYQPEYRGGAGMEHGSLFGEMPTRMYKGRLFIVLGTTDASISDMLQVLGLKAQLVALQTTTKSSSKTGPSSAPQAEQQHEAVSVQPLLYRAASQVLQQIEPVLAPYNTSAIHIVGHSLAGGAATLLATILEGHLAVAHQQAGAKKSAPKKKKTKRETTSATSISTKGTVENNNATDAPRTVSSGWGRGRTSCVTLGAPPSCSTNVPTDGLVISLVYGDDWVSRTTDASLQRLVARIEPILKRRKSLTKHVALFSDTVKLATHGFTSHAHGREGEETRLASTGGQAYLLRPRRYGNHVSIHEMGRASGREAIRAAVLWQLSDILLSPSYAKHHTLDSYIHGLDRVHVRGLEDGATEATGLEEWDDEGGLIEETAKLHDDENEEDDDDEDEDEDDSEA